MAKYRKGYRVDPRTGLTKPEEKAGLTRPEAEAQAGVDEPASRRRKPTIKVPSGKGGHRTAWIVAGSVAGVLVLLIIIGIAVGGGDDGGSGSSSPGNVTTGAAEPAPPPPPEPTEANITVVKKKSFCLATGISDIYTGDGRVTFYLTLRNTGDKADSFDLQPVRLYDDGDTNESPLDQLHVDSVPAHGTWRGRSPSFKYKAHEHEVVGCGLRPGGDGDELQIEVVH